MGNYTNATDLRLFRIPKSTAAPDFTNWTDDELNAVIDDVEQFIEKTLCDFFYQKSAQTIYADGTKGSRIHLPQDARYPHKIISITSVDEVDFDRTTVIESYTEGSDYVVDGDYILQADISQPTRNRFRTGRLQLWPQGKRNIRIVGDFGLATVPLNIIKAVSWLSIVNTLGETKAGFSGSFGEGGASEEHWEDYRVKRGAYSDVIRKKIKDVPNITGYTEIDLLLKDFVNYSDLFVLPTRE
jgi:hypothetical protein